MRHWMRMGAVFVALVAIAAGVPLANAATAGHARAGTHGRAHTAQASGAAVAISPQPGAQWALPQTQISFLGAPAGALSNISVVASRSGNHPGVLHSYVSQTGASFVPQQPFVPGDHVAAQAVLTTAAGPRALSTSFTVVAPAKVQSKPFPAKGNPKDVQTFHSLPGVHPAPVRVALAAHGTALGLIFASPALGPGQPGPMILDNRGQVVWFHPLPRGDSATDFGAQTYQGQPVITWWQGRLLALGYGLGEGVIVNSAYQTVAIVKAGNGQSSDLHEFLLTPQGSAFLTAYSPVATSLASVHGPARAVVLDSVIQEVDPKTGLVMYEWHCLDHVPLSQSHSPVPKKGAYDYFHLNSININSDGSLLISARNTWALYDIDTPTGNLNWALGGKATSFRLGRGVPFAFQHNAVQLANGQISLFDDDCCGMAGKPPKIKLLPPVYAKSSRGEIIALDLQHHTATLAQQFVHSAGNLLATASQGNLQQLPNGNWIVGFGGLPNFTEFNARGQMVFDASFPKGENSYRVYRFPWSGQPVTPPAVAALRSGSKLNVYASWNGATGVASWQVLGGSDPAHLTTVASSPARGFETAIASPAATYVAVRALSGSGQVLGTSGALHVH